MSNHITGLPLNLHALMSANKINYTIYKFVSYMINDIFPISCIIQSNL